MTDKINATVSLIKTNNIIVINMLIESGCITDEFLLLALKQHYLSRQNITDIRTISTLFDLLEPIIDKETTDKLFRCLINLYSQNNKDIFASCFKKIVDLGAYAKINKYLLSLPTDLFFYYVSKNDDQPISIKSMVYGMDDSAKCNWCYEKFMNSNEINNPLSVCKMTVAAYNVPDKSYFENLIPIIYDLSLNDAVMLNILVQTDIDDYIMKYILDCDHADELMFFSLLLLIVSDYNCGIKLTNQDAIKIKSFLEAKEDARIIFNELSYFCDGYGEIYDKAINNIILLMNMYHSQ